MRILGDYHTHSTYSRNNHGKSTILENAEIAKQKGLKEIAITDHGYAHRFYGVDRKEIINLKKEIEEAKEKTGVNILYGIEANITSLNGDTDIVPHLQSEMDIVLMGYHKMVKPMALKDDFSFFFYNYAKSIFGPTKNSITKFTDAYLRAIDKCNIDIITHLNYGMIVDPVKIAKLANQKNVYIELNGKRTLFTEEQIEELIAMKTKFIINSDAHKHQNVGNFKTAVNFAIKNRIPDELIVNVNKIPEFKSHKRD